MQMHARTDIRCRETSKQYEYYVTKMKVKGVKRCLYPARET